MERSKFRLRQNWKARFHNRLTAIETVEGYLRQYQLDPNHLRVISLLGIGGVGKTRLLDHIGSRAPKTMAIVHANLESDAANPIVGPLKVIRNQIKAQCLLFDCAVIAYWSATGHPLQTPPIGGFSESLIVKSVETAGDVFGIPLPLSFARDAFAAIQRRSARSRFYKSAEFEAIDELRSRPDEILARLPHFLGLDIERRLKAGAKRTVFFYDAYEKQSRGTLTGKSEWLREFIGTLDRSIHVIATREGLRWGEEWQDVSEEIVVGELALVDSHALVRGELPDADDGAVDKIVSVAGGVPFFLEAGLDAYLRMRTEHGSVDTDDLPVSQPQSISRLLDHLTDDERIIVTALSVLQVFDEALFLGMGREFNVSLGSLQFSDLISMFFVEPADSKDELYKIHNLIAAFVDADSRTGLLRRQIIASAARLLAARTAGGLSPELALVFLQSLVRSMGDGTAARSDIERVFEIGYHLYDRGFWRELSAIMADHAGQPGDGGLVAGFFTAICQRRIFGVAPALAALERLAPRARDLGKYRDSIAVERAYLEELGGDYRAAAATFEAIQNSDIVFDSTSRIHVRARLYNADMQIMKGRFRDGAALLIETAEALDASVRIDWAELTRHRAHAYRFCYLNEDAEALYLRALDAASDSPGLVAKLRTNLAEVRCWHDPVQALQDGQLSLELNDCLGNRIEIGKARVSMAIAAATLGEFAAAAEHIGESRKTFEGVGYSAGLIFADVAEGLLAISRGTADLDAIASSASARATRLGVYGHLLIPLRHHRARLNGSDLGKEAQWIDHEAIAGRLDLVLARLTGSARAITGGRPA